MPTSERCSKGTHKTKKYGCLPNTPKSMKKKPTAYIAYSKSVWQTHKPYLTKKLKAEGMASVNAWIKDRYMGLQVFKKVRGKTPSPMPKKKKKVKKPTAAKGPKGPWGPTRKGKATK